VSNRVCESLRQDDLYPSWLSSSSQSQCARVPPSRNPYPSELKGFKFYAKYLAPLRPSVFESAAVLRVLGEKERLDLSGSTIWAAYTTKGGPVCKGNASPWTY
jgi:hypothetical protein